jgi:hypothetical protein
MICLGESEHFRFNYPAESESPASPRHIRNTKTQTVEAKSDDQSETSLVPRKPAIKPKSNSFLLNLFEGGKKESSAGSQLSSSSSSDSSSALLTENKVVESAKTTIMSKFTKTGNFIGNPTRFLIKLKFLKAFLTTKTCKSSLK